MELVKVVKLNREDPNPWIPSELPFVVESCYHNQGREFLVIRPFGASSKNSHYIPKDCTDKFIWGEK
jgi:hypothetical protein